MINIQKLIDKVVDLTMEGPVDYIEDLVNSLTKDELIHFLITYNNYVQDFYYYHDSDSTPVSILEFFNNVYDLCLQEELDEGLR